MAQTGKYGYIRPGDALEEIRAEEPVFILRAQDMLSVLTINAYLRLARDAGCDEEHIAGVEAQMREFSVWQSRNHVKIPD